MAFNKRDDVLARANGRIPSLNGWRALAIILVLLSHWPYTMGFPPATFPGIVEQGDLGVRIFFVLSGFLITHLLLREAEKDGSVSLKRFYIRRCLRILPVYFCYLGVLGLLTIAGKYADFRNSWIGCLTFTRNIIGDGKSATAHFWSLAVEEQFYLLWPCCLSAFALWGWRKGVWLALAVPILFCPLVRFHGFRDPVDGVFLGHLLGVHSIFSYADSLAVGCLGAFLARRIAYGLKPGLASLIIFVAMLSIGLGAFWTGEQGAGRVAEALVPSLQAVATMVAIYVMIQHQSGLAYRLFNCALMEWLGVLSYSIYIWQQLFLAHYAGDRLGGYFIYDWRIWWLPALGVATISYYFVEKPILRLKDRICR